MRVLHLISPTSQWGGGDTILLNIVGTKIEGEMDEVALIYDSPRLRAELDKLNIKYYVIQDKVIPVEKSGKKYEILRMISNIFCSYRLRRVLKSGNYDVIHAHGFSAAWMFYWTHYEKSWCVYTHHAFRHMSKGVERLILTPVYNRFDQCTAVSDTAAVSMNQAFPGMKKKFIGIQNCINANFFKEKVNANHIHREDGKKYFIQAARLMDRKNQDLVIRAVADLPEKSRKIVRVVFCGGGPNLDKLQELAKQLEVEENIIFAGEVEYEKVPEYMDECDFGLFPTEIEGFGLGAAECMARGLPVLALDNEVMREVVGDAGILVQKDRLSGGFVQMLKTGDELRTSARERAEKYKPQVMKEAYFHLYTKNKSDTNY